MAESNIEWTHRPRPDGSFMPGYTGNVWQGCTKVHEGCDNCYAEALTNRWGKKCWGPDNPRIETKTFFPNMHKWNEESKKAGEVRNVFIGSLMDIAEKAMPLVHSDGEPMDGMTTDDLRNVFFNKVPDYTNLQLLLLSKRPSNYNKQTPESWKTAPPKTVMFGTSPVNQPTYDNLYLHLAQVPGRRFLSIEPMLGPITMHGYCKTCGELSRGSLLTCRECGKFLEYPDWVIVGGESGPKRRPFDLDWARSIRDQCDLLDIPFFFKQIDKVIEKTHGIPEDLQIRQHPELA